MSATVLLLLLRVGSAILLLAFFGLVVWFLYQDLRAARAAPGGQGMTLGALRVIANALGEPTLNTLYELSPVTTIGRSSRNTIVLDDTYVSSDHVLLAWRDSQWWLEDLGSRNGTLLNDAPLTEPAVISAGDVLTIGSVQLKLETPGRKGEESGIRDSNP
ncbi:FHA domain-containing protein [Promineifilum sp.]|uniref:FHA domain-containing protein n=1 Tax=Promineifilum sp. TaxID=2664178 RepID=UPI0035B24AD4